MAFYAQPVIDSEWEEGLKIAAEAEAAEAEAAETEATETEAAE